MVDESFDTKFKDMPPKPDEFRAKPTYQKLFVITAGVMMNLTLAIGIFAGINYFKGKQVAKTTTVGYLTENSAAAEAQSELLHYHFPLLSDQECHRK